MFNICIAVVGNTSFVTRLRLVSGSLLLMEVRKRGKADFSLGEEVRLEICKIVPGIN
jgi:hypothetical protein